MSRTAIVGCIGIWSLSALTACTGVLSGGPPSAGGAETPDAGAVAPGYGDAGPPDTNEAAMPAPDAGVAPPSCTQTMCPDGCVDTSSDPNDCGACGTVCSDGATCQAGTCLPAPVPPPPAGAPPQAVAAYQRMNQVRAAMGVPYARMDLRLNQASRLHCQYYAQNQGSGSCVSDPHVEVSGCSSYTAAEFWDRDSAAGYGGAGYGFEVMDFVGDGATSAQDWIDSVWHRSPMLDPWTRDMGYGGAAGCDTIDFGTGAGASTPPSVVVTYPYANQVGVPPSFAGYEEPAPPAPPSGFPSGYPITIYTMGTITDHVLTVDGSSTPIQHIWLAPNDPQSMMLLTDDYFMYSYQPLQSGTRYHVHVAGTTFDGSPMTLDWTFTTR